LVGNLLPAADLGRKEVAKELLATSDALLNPLQDASAALAVWLAIRRIGDMCDLI
jgi:hypothetical protein